MVEERPNGVLRVEEYNLKDFMLLVQDLVRKGYEISLEGQNYPNGSGSFYSCGMVKSNTEVEVEQVEPETQENDEPVQQPAKRGRKPASK